MLSYFPQIYPDELLYSVLARYHRHTCSSSPKQTLDDLFGSRNVRASIALQGSIGSLCERIPPARRLTPRRLALENTLFPYYTAFEPAVVGRMVLEAMSSGSIEGVHVRLGIAASKVPVPGYLRYCPACRSEMSKGQGELYWRRAHQLPGALVYRHDRQWLQENSPAQLERSGSTARVDWPAVDRQFAADIPVLAGRIKTVKPPTRVSFVEIERGLSKPGWISKRAQKLPLTVAAINGVVEGLVLLPDRRPMVAVVDPWA